MKIKRNPTDKLFSDLVRERANWCCETCHTYYPEGRRSGLDCSHIFKRWHKSIRWEPNAAIAQCTYCHTRNPADANPFMAKKIIGEKEYRRLEIKCHGTLPMPKWYEKEIRKKLRAAWKLMQERRVSGERGRLDFDSPY